MTITTDIPLLTEQQKFTC